MTDTETFKALCAEAKDLMKRLEGSTVHSVTVELDDAKIKVERATAVVSAGAPAPVVSGPIPMGAITGPGISPGARGASGTFAAIGQQADNRIPVLAPLVGTFYRRPRRARSRSSRSARPSAPARPSASSRR